MIQIQPAWAIVSLLVVGEVLHRLVGATAAADELVLPQAVERKQSVEFVYRFDKAVTGHGFLDVEWTNVDSRVVERRRIPLDLVDTAEVRVPLDTRQAVTMKNRAGYAALKRLGVTAGMVLPWQLNSNTEDPTAPLLDNDMRWYIENIATDFYSTYHRWSGDRPVNWKFLAVKKRYRDNPLDPEALVRKPSLSDPEWLAKIRDRLMRVVAAQRPYRPLYYNLGDETGIADLAAFWVFDFSEYSLAAMRDWLKERYGSLTALNQEWGSEFARWEEVKPMTTREAMLPSDQNFAAWADFKEWMDVAFAHVAEVIHQADPEAVAAVEGGQIPG